MIAAGSPFGMSRIKRSCAHDTPLVARAEREKTKQMTNIGNPAGSRILEGERLANDNGPSHHFAASQ
jgi:hypothetical protein